MISPPETAAPALVGSALEAWRMNATLLPIHVSWAAGRPPSLEFVPRNSWPDVPEPEAVDLESLDNEQLVVLAAEREDRAARDELIRRFLPLMTRFICRQATRTGLQDADKQDVKQEAVLWMLEAICHYRTREYAHPGGCQFSSFLQRVLAARFIDALRRRQRQRSHFPLTAAEPSDPAQDTRRRYPGDPSHSTARDRADPVRQAEEGELHASLLRAVARLDAPARQLWDLLAEGKPLREAARVLQLSYDAAKRRRRELLARLRSWLVQNSGQ